MTSRLQTAPDREVVITPWGRSDSLRSRMLRPGPGTPAGEVAQNQRERLFGAMVASVSTVGYKATRVTDLVELSGVSRRSFYDLYADKQACFQATIEAMLSAGIELALSAESRGADWEERAVNRFQAFARLVVEQPAAARMSLIEAHTAGPEALRPVETATETLERITAERFAESPERAGMPEEMTAAFVGATLEIARTRIHRGTEAELQERMPELMELLLSYRPPPEQLRMTTRPPTAAPETIDAHDHSERALRALAAVAAEEGYANTRVGSIVKRASMSPTTFYANFSGKDDLMSAAIESAGAQLTAAVMPPFRRSADWAQGVRTAYGAFFNFLASRPTLAHLLVVEVYAAGPEAVRRRAEALRPLEAVLAEGRARAQQVTALWVEAISGAVYALARRQIRRSGPESLPGLAPVCTYLTLAPFLGAGAACEAANGDGRARGASGTDLPTRLMLSKLMQLFIERPDTLEVAAARLERPPHEVLPLIEQLQASGMLEAVREKNRTPRLGRVVYRPNWGWLDDTEWAKLSLRDRQRISAGIGHMITGEMDQALEDGSFDSRIDRHLTRTQVNVDQQGWTELMAIHDRAFLAGLEVIERSSDRLRRSGEKAIEGRSFQVLYEAPNTFEP